MSFAASRGDRTLTVLVIRARPAARSTVGVGNLARRSRTPACASRDPTARSSAGETLVRASRSRLVSRVRSAARSMSNPLRTRSLLEQLVAAGVEPVDLAAPQPGGVRDHERVAAVGLGFTRIEISGAAHHQTRHVGDRHVAGGPRRRSRAERSSRAGRSPTRRTPCSTRLRQQSHRGRLRRCRSTGRTTRSPLSSNTSAKCSSLPTSSPIHTVTSSGVATLGLLSLEPSRAGRPSQVRSPSSTLRTSDRSHVPIRGSRTRPCRWQHPPGRQRDRGQ